MTRTLHVTIINDYDIKCSTKKLCLLTLILLVANFANTILCKKAETETLSNGYSSESTQ